MHTPTRVRTNIHRAQFNFFISGLVTEEALDNVLTIVECAADCKVVDILLCASSHLCFLDSTDTTLRVEDSDRDILLTPEAIDSRGSSVTTRRTNNGEVVPILPFFADIPLGEQVLEKVSEELKSTILEGVRGAVEDLKQVDVAFQVQGNQRHDIF